MPSLGIWTNGLFLDTYFTGLSVEQVDEGKGWKQIEGLKRLWEK